MQKQKMKLTTGELTRMALCVALLVVSGFIRIPLPITPTPVTAQTLVVNLLALILLPRQALMTSSTFLLLGIVGLPVFGGNGGLGALVGPTGGYLVGFVVASFCISACYHGMVKRYSKQWLCALFATVVVGMPVIYLFGSIWMSVVMHTTLVATLLSAIVPYLGGDLLKCVAAIAVAIPLNRALRRSDTSFSH